VIDGQQRLTTIQLALEAFGDVCRASGADRHHKALLKLTRNDDPLSEDPDEQFKVWPTNVDQSHFRAVMDVTGPEELRRAYRKKKKAVDVDQPIADAYLFFYSAIHEWLRPDETGVDSRVDALLTTLREYVRMVVIDLGPEDDAQVIFETLNARGTPLLPADLVKNYLYHRAQLEGEDIDRLHRTCWKIFDDEDEYWREEVGRGHAKRARIDTFFQHYLSLKTAQEIPVAHLYTAFREYAADKKTGAARAQLESLRDYAKIYRRFDRMEAGTPEALFFARLAEMEITTAYPFLLQLWARHGEGDSAAIRPVLVDLESFLERRMVCQLNTRGYNKLFVDILAALEGPREELAERVRTFLLASDAESTRWPDDSEFRSAWLERPAYRVLRKSRVRMLLEALERQLHGGKTEKLSFGEKLTVEHLLPRKWRKHWPLPGDVPTEEAEDRRDRHLHTMGNLTLLTKKLNPSISNGPWEKKRSAILEHSALSLNRSLVQDWGEARIGERGRALFDTARRIWSRPAGDARRSGD
jgi:hypothetical protein